MMAERDDAIIAAVARGISQRDVAQDWGISRERVRQICKRVGLTARLWRDARWEEARAAIRHNDYRHLKRLGLNDRPGSYKR